MGPKKSDFIIADDEFIVIGLGIFGEALREHADFHPCGIHYGTGHQTWHREYHPVFIRKDLG